MSRLGHLWSIIWSSFWFVPFLIVTGSITLAVGLIHIDTLSSDRWLAQWPILFGAGSEGARAMMSTIAGSMITVVGVTFSTILVVLALASSQYTSRILRNFMRSRVTQIVLGIFAGIFAYCLIVLRTIRNGDEGAFVPNLAVSVGFAIALGGVGALIFFIHHIASSIQASSIIASVARETITAIDRLFPAELGRGVETQTHAQRPHPAATWSWRTVPARGSGYIENVNGAALLDLARDRQTVVWMHRSVGDFVVDKTPLASLAMADAPDPRTIARLQAGFSIGRHRTVDQDATFGIRQIVDVALKALSPGITDTTTAVICVDYLTTILARIAPRHTPASHRYADGELRVIAKGPSFATLVAQSFDQIRGKSGGDVAVIMCLLESLETLASLTPDPARRRLLRQHVLWIDQLAQRTVKPHHDRATIDAALARVREAFDAEPAPLQPAAGSAKARH